MKKIPMAKTPARRPAMPGLGPRLAVLALALTGCTVVANTNGSQPPTVLVTTGLGPKRVNLNGPNAAPPPGGPLASPPAGTANTLPSPTRTATRSGSYAGTAEPFNTGGGDCLGSHQVSGWHVNGRSVRFGGFRGRVSADDTLQMASGQNWIVGHFEGATFHGQFDMNGRFGLQGCSFILSLKRVGP